MRYLLLALLAFGIYKGVQDVWYFTRDPSELQIPLHRRTPATSGLDGSAFECISRYEEWRRALPHMKPSCQPVKAFRHWLAEAQSRF